MKEARELLQAMVLLAVGVALLIGMGAVSLANQISALAVLLIIVSFVVMLVKLMGTGMTNRLL